jgi:cytochrome P450
VLGGHEPDPESVKDLKFIEAAAYEALRLHPPAPMLPKIAMVDNQVGKYHIRKGTIPYHTVLCID